jgi:hypothetical protein
MADDKLTDRERLIAATVLSGVLKVLQPMIASAIHEELAGVIETETFTAVNGVTDRERFAACLLKAKTANPQNDYPTRLRAALKEYSAV